MAKPRRSWLNADYATVLCVAKSEPEGSVMAVFVPRGTGIFAP
jgi:hypothetical protein